MDNTRSFPTHFSMVRNFHLADVVTLSNAALGTGSILAALAYMDGRDPRVFVAAVFMLVGALVADVMDGVVARKRGRASAMGRELDSLADVISFGVAPAVLGYAAGLRTGLDAVALTLLVLAGVSRLARFNITAEGLSGPTGKVRHYEGTPITSSLVLVGVLLACVVRGRTGDALPGGTWGTGLLAFHPLVAMYLASGAAMVSRTLRVPKP